MKTEGMVFSGCTIIINGKEEEKRGEIRFTVFYPSLKLYLKGLHDMVLTDTQKVDLSISPVDAKGQPAKVDGAPVWSSSDDSVLELQVAADGMSASALAGNVGHAQVSVVADADLGEGVVSISGVLEVDVVAGQAVSLAINAGTPSEQ